jgi:DNA-binding NarL/FixJ family response regulator
MAIEINKIEDLKRLQETERAAREELRKAERLLSLLNDSGYRTAKELASDLKQIEGREEELRGLCKQYLTAAGAFTVSGGGATRKRLTDEQKQEVAEMLKDGNTAREVAEFYGVSAATVNKIKSDCGLTAKKKAAN